VRFLFGSGWWVLWYLGFYAFLLVFVVLFLVVFGQELKAPGEKPDLASPGSMTVFLVAFGLAAVTLANGFLFVRVLAAPMVAKALVPLALAALVLGVGLSLNYRLAVEQSRPAFRANVLYTVTTVAGNLVLMWLARTRRPGSIAPFGA
jgi:hypothetical protein